MTTKKGSIRIGNAGGYWGDDPEALYRQVMGGDLDYISMDFLAEVTMSILQKQRREDPSLGYAKDFLPMLESVLAEALKRKIKIITNAGGVNPKACGKAVLALASKLGLSVKIALVMGDDILPQLDSLGKAGAAFTNMETGENFDSVKSRVEAANVYFGALPVVQALASNPDIIITGRVTDTGITLAPMIYEFDWKWHDYDKLAAGIVAGHVLECGSQSTGGNFTDWEKVESFKNMGYPLVDVYPDGTLVFTKHEKLGGMVTVDTIREQLFYEMGDPKAYITPDVVADFSTINLKQLGPNQVQASGIKGFPSTDSYKISMAYSDGFKASGMLVLSGPFASKKAQKFAEIFWQRCGTDFAEVATDYFGWNACHRSLGHSEDGNEIMLRLSVRDYNKEKLKRFGKLIPSLILGGPPGITVIGGVPRAAEVVSYWPALMAKNLVQPKIGILTADGLTEQLVTTTVSGDFKPQGGLHKQIALSATQSIASSIGEPKLPGNDYEIVPLSRLCLGRSGDKGDTCNIGLIARNQEIFKYLESQITAQQVKNWFQELCLGQVTRYKLDSLMGYNFLLESSLGGGGTHSLRIDPQGKTFAQALLRQRIVVPKTVLATLA